MTQLSAQRTRPLNDKLIEIVSALGTPGHSCFHCRNTRGIVAAGPPLSPLLGVVSHRQVSLDPSCV